MLKKHLKYLNTQIKVCINNYICSSYLEMNLVFEEKNFNCIKKDK